MNLPRRASALSVFLVTNLLAIGALTLGLVVLSWAGPAEARRQPAPIRRPVPVAAAKAPAAQPALPPVEPFAADAPEKLELIVDKLHARLVRGDPKTVLTVGSSSFLTVTIGDPGGNKQATLLAEAEAGAVPSIKVEGIKLSPIPGGQAAEFPLPASGTTTVTVEFALKVSGKGPDGRSRGRLRLTLLPQKGGHDEAIVSWPLADCSGDYKAELTKIINDRRERMIGTLDVVSATEPVLPSTWLFPPPKPAPVAGRCGVQRGKKPAACPATGAKPADEAAAAADEARIIELASAVQQQKGALPQFQRHTQPMRQASYTLLSSLRLYMEQDAHPALCNGVDYMIEYYQSRTSLLKGSIEDNKRALADAQSMALARVSALTPAAATAAGSFDVGSLLERVGAMVLSSIDAPALAGDQDVWSKLHRLRAALDSPAASQLATDRRVATIAALSMIEASQYLNIAVAKYVRIDEMIYGTLSAIADAHKLTCVCGT